MCVCVPVCVCVCVCVCPSQVRVLYGGTELFDNEVRQTFHSDMLLALISGACIAVLVYILTSFSGRSPQGLSLSLV